MTIRPETDVLRPCLVFREFILPSILGRLLLGVLLVPPGEADRELRETHVKRLGARRTAKRLHHDLADDPLVAVVLVPLDVDCFPEDHRRHGLLRALAEGLSLLGGIDAGEPDLVLFMVGVEDGDRVAVGYRDDGTGEGVGLGGEGGRGRRSRSGKSRLFLCILQSHLISRNSHETLVWTLVRDDALDPDSLR